MSGDENGRASDALANNVPANADYRFHGALIALSANAVNTWCVTLETDFQNRRAKLFTGSKIRLDAMLSSQSDGHNDSQQVFMTWLRKQNAKR
jgi:hypothetical protein